MSEHNESAAAQTGNESGTANDGADAQGKDVNTSELQIKHAELEKANAGLLKKLNDVNSEAKGKREKNNELKDQIAILTAKLDQGLTNEDVDKQIGSLKASHSKELESLTNNNKRLTGMVQELKITGKIASAAKKYKAKNSDVVVRMLADKVKLTEIGDVQVLDEKGRKEYDGEHLMTVDRMVELYLKQSDNLWMVESETKTGSGSTASAPSAATLVAGQIPLGIPQEQYNAARDKQKNKKR